ncbi:MAG: hypothetical protein V1755_11135 [Chloroflexota bacterium]
MTKIILAHELLEQGITQACAAERPSPNQNATASSMKGGQGPSFAAIRSQRPFDV